MNPECAAGKHGNCSGEAWDHVNDWLTTCVCACHADHSVEFSDSTP